MSENALQKTQHEEILPEGLTGLSNQSRNCSTRRIGHEPRYFSSWNDSYSRLDDRTPLASSSVVEVGERNFVQDSKPSECKAYQAHCNQ